MIVLLPARRLAAPCTLLLQWTGLALVAATCLLGAPVAAAQATSPLVETVILPSGEECDVTRVLYSDFTTKAGLYPVGTQVTGLVVECNGTGSPVTRTFILIEQPDGEARLVDGRSSTGSLIGLGFAADPFEVGRFESTGSSFYPYHAYRFNLDTEEFQDLGALGGSAGTSVARGVNIDGTVVVGESNLTTAGNSVAQAFRWTPALGMQKLGAIQPNGYSRANATNQDGTVVVGDTDVPGAKPGDYDGYHAFRWVLGNPATGAGTFTDLGAATATALAVSGDGSVVVGAGTGNKAFRWTQAGGAVSLGALPGHSFSLATAVSADGNVVVGISSTRLIPSDGFKGVSPTVEDNASRAFRWTQATGMVDLNTLAADAGYDMTGITLLGALRVSANGRTITGVGIRNGTDDTTGFSVVYATPVTALATIVTNPYGAVAVEGATLSGTTIRAFQKSPIIKLGPVAGAAGSFAQIDLDGLGISSDVVLTIQSGAANQSIWLRNTAASAGTIAGRLRAAGGSGASAPAIYLQSASGVKVVAGGAVEAPGGLTVDALGATVLSGGVVDNAGALRGGPSLRLLGARITGGGAFSADAILISTFGNANNPVNGSHFLANGLQLSPGTGASVALTVNDYGTSPQFFNLKVLGDGSLSMPSAWPGGSTLPANNAPVPFDATRPPGVSEPTFGGGSMIIQSTGSMKVMGGTSGDLAFPGAIAIIAAGTIDLGGVRVNQGWTTTGRALQGLFFESPSIVSTGGDIRALTNNLNWINFSTFPHAAVRAWSLVPQPNGGAAYATADDTAPHLNTFSVLSEAAANGECWVCLVNSPVVDMRGP